MKEDKLSVYKKINIILSDWDPINVDSPIRFDEYSGYIPELYEALNQKEDIKPYLLKIINNLGISYNDRMEDDIIQIENKLQQIIGDVPG